MTAVPAKAAVAPRTPERTAIDDVPPAYWILGAFLILAPAFCSNFVLLQILGWSMILGMIALSLMFLAGYGGMVSLVQMTVAGLAAYLSAIFGTSGITTVSLNWPWWLAIPMALVLAVLFGTVVGALAVRTAGIYTIMITLAVAAAFFYFTQQNYVIFNGFTGFNKVAPPIVFGVDWRDPIAYYYFVLFWAALAFFTALYISRAPFGLTLQGVRDNPRRMAALGFNVTAHRVAAYAFASLIAAVGGVLLVWLNGQVSPGTVAVGPAIDILIIAVVGGIGHPIGAFIGALIYVVLRTFALDALVSVGLPGERYQLLIGLGFLIVVLLSPDGILGIWTRLRARRPGRANPERGTPMSAVVERSVAERLSSAGTANALELRGVTKLFGALAALTDISLSIRPGERRAVLGSNGAGKTTLFNCITGDFLPTAGTIRLFGEDVTRFPAHERIRRGLRRTYQISLLFTGLSVLDNVYLAGCGVSRNRFSFLRPRRDDALMATAERLTEAVHLTEVRHSKVAELSYGQQRQLEIALALAGAPRFVLFDEPAAGLSPTERRDLVAILTNLPGHMGFIIIEHDMDVALRVAESVTMMHNGRIFKEGAPDEIEADPEVQELYLGGGHA